MRTINKDTYSPEDFPDRRLRVMVKFIKPDGTDFIYTIYTTCGNIDKVSEDIFEIIDDRIDTYEIFHYATKAQDEASEKFVNEWILKI